MLILGISTQTATGPTTLHGIDRPTHSISRGNFITHFQPRLYIAVDILRNELDAFN